MLDIVFDLLVSAVAALAWMFALKARREARKAKELAQQSARYAMEAEKKCREKNSPLRLLK